MNVQPGEVVLVVVPTLDGTDKNRPALVLCKLPGLYQEALVCGFSSQLDVLEENWDETITEADSDFKISGLHAPSSIRLSYLIAVGAGEVLGIAGYVSKERLYRLQQRLANRLLQSL